MKKNRYVWPFVASATFMSGVAFAQSRPANSPEGASSPAIQPDSYSTRSLARALPPEPMPPPDVVESHPGGCPEGPPCPDASGSTTKAAPMDCGDGADCKREE